LSFPCFPFVFDKKKQCAFKYLKLNIGAIFNYSKKFNTRIISKSETLLLSEYLYHFNTSTFHSPSLTFSNLSKVARKEIYQNHATFLTFLPNQCCEVRWKTLAFLVILEMCSKLINFVKWYSLNLSLPIENLFILLREN